MASSSAQVARAVSVLGREAFVKCSSYLLVVLRNIAYNPSNTMQVALPASLMLFVFIRGSITSRTILPPFTPPSLSASLLSTKLNIGLPQRF